MNEFKDIPGYEGHYRVDDNGVVFGLKRIDPTTNNLRKAKIRKQGKSTFGYMRITLIKNGKPKSFAAHRLVAMAFIPNPENKPQVNHKDGNKLNNHVSNLEWCTSQENIHHAIKTGLTTFKKGNDHFMSGRTGLKNYASKKVQCLMTGTVMNFRDASKFLQVDESYFGKMVKGKIFNWTNFILA